jgi:transcriptional regulator with XRE-family HTH domain
MVGGVPFVKNFWYAYSEQSSVSERNVHMSNSFGEKIRDLRKAKGLTLDQLAAKTGSSKSYIWELENKNPPRPSAEKIAKIAEVLETTSDYLMDVHGLEEKGTAEDLAFFRKYRTLDGAKKDTIRQMLDIIKKNG